MATILILAALPEEAGALFPGTGARAGGLFAERRLATAGHDVTIATCGLGKVNAALCAGALAGDAAMLLMTGTCGSLGAAPGGYWIDHRSVESRVGSVGVSRGRIGGVP